MGFISWNSKIWLNILKNRVSTYHNILFNRIFFPSSKPLDVLMPLLVGKISITIPIDILHIEYFIYVVFYTFIFKNVKNRIN